MTRLVKNVTEIESDDENIHLLLVEVNAGGSDFVECYVGVDDTSVFHSKYSYIDHHDNRFEFIEREAFKKFGSMKYYDPRNINIQDSKPLDYAWLSFARSGKTYDFLKDDFFYYSAGFEIKKYHKHLNYDGCLEAAKIQIQRLLDAINAPNNFDKPREALEEEIWEYLIKSDYYGKTFYGYNNTIGVIPVHINKQDTKLVLYDFDKSINQKIWQVLHLSLFIRADGTIYKNPCYDKNWPELIFTNIMDAIIFSTSRNGLSSKSLDYLDSRIHSYYSKDYWLNLRKKASDGKLNKHERNNLQFLLKYLESKCLKN